ncbi:MAG: hypothetical protein WC843_06210 [Candidatus Gracilibacteria bacterium]|jgi:hypothetical protein
MNIKEKFLEIYVTVGTVLTAIFGLLTVILTGQGTLFQGKLGIDQNLVSQIQNRDIAISQLESINISENIPLKENQGNVLLKLNLQALKPISFQRGNLISINLYSNQSFGNVKSCSLSFIDPQSNLNTLVDEKAPVPTLTSNYQVQKAQLPFDFSKNKYALNSNESATVEVKCNISAKIDHQNLEASLDDSKDPSPSLFPVTYSDSQGQTLQYNPPSALMGATATF